MLGGKFVFDPNGRPPEIVLHAADNQLLLTASKCVKRRLGTPSLFGEEIQAQVAETLMEDEVKRDVQNGLLAWPQCLIVCGIDRASGQRGARVVPPLRVSIHGCTKYCTHVWSLVHLCE